MEPSVPEPDTWNLHHSTRHAYILLECYISKCNVIRHLQTRLHVFIFVSFSLIKRATIPILSSPYSLHHGHFVVSTDCVLYIRIEPFCFPDCTLFFTENTNCLSLSKREKKKDYMLTCEFHLWQQF